MEPDPLDDYQIEGAEPGSDISYKYVEMNSDLQFIERPIAIDEFKTDMSKRNFEIEFRLIRRLTESQMHVQCLKDYNPEVTKLNRYNNIIPFKHTMVELPPKDADDQKEADTYINANFLAASKKTDSKAFIATQGPLDGTKGHFWRMIWNNNVSTIIMLCNFSENGKTQCDCYWQEKTGQSPLVVDDLRIKTLEESDAASNFNIRKFSIENTQEEGSEPKIVTHYQWLGWPDHGVPTEEDFESIDQLLTILHDERKKNSTTPIVIHCSAGIGRTGTLISIYNLDLVLKEAVKKKGDEKKVKLSVFSVVRRLREQRWGMVNNEKQYKFVYNYIADRIEKTINELTE